MKKMRKVNFICYLLVTYILSSLYGIIFRLEVPEILKFENLINLSVLFLLLLITGYLITNFFKSLKEVFRSGAKKLSYVLVIIYGVNINNVALIYAVSICLIVAYAVLFIENKQIKKKIKIDESENEPELYPSRRNLMEVLNDALEGYNLIALDGTWGSGKTTFMKIAMRYNREKYYYIPINVMLFENSNYLKTEFLNQLKRIFKEEGIFQGSLMDFDYYLDGVSNDWVKVVKNIMFSKSKSFKEANEKLKCEIRKIEKRIVVGVDNLERIYGESEPEWKQILGFIHELQELGIKIVVMANLEEMLTTEKETGEKDLSNYEYFDKFYEFKLKLNEVNTGEIIDKVEIKKEELVKKNNIVDREWLKEQIKELTKTLEIGKEVLNDDAEEKKDIKILYNELHERYLKNIVNPRKIGKIIKNIENKKKTIENIYKFINDDEYEKLIFKASIFSSVYFDYMNEIKSEEFNDFIVDKKININNFFGYFFKNIGESHRGMKRLLHHDAEEGLVIKRIENIIKNKGKDEFDLELILKDLEVYSSSLDPDFDQKTTKEAYKIIESKLIELEESNREKIHGIIKENEKFICKMNYLCNPHNVGMYEKLEYKFEIILITKSYEKFLISLDPKGTFAFLQRTEEVFWLVEKYFNLGSLKLKEDEKSIDELINMIDNKKNPNIIMELKNRSLDLFFSEEAERVKLKRMITLLNILKIELGKRNIENKKDSLIVTLEEWKESNKLKVLLELENYYNAIKFEYKERKIKDIKVLRETLEKIIAEEKNEECILKLERLIKKIKGWEFPIEIIDMALKINMEQNLDIKEKKKGELIDFINEKTKDKRYQYIYNGDWDLWEGKLKEIGIEVDFANKKVNKTNNEKI